MGKKQQQTQRKENRFLKAFFSYSTCRKRANPNRKSPRPSSAWVLSTAPITTNSVCA